MEEAIGCRFEEVGIFDPPSIVWPRFNHLPGGNQRKIEIIIEYDYILNYFTLSTMYNSDGQQQMGRVDYLWGASEETSVFYQASWCEFQIEFKFGMEDKKRW